MRARTIRALRVSFPATRDFRELAVRLVAGAGLLVERADPDFCRELVATFEGLLDRIEQPQGTLEEGGQMALAIEHGDDFIRIEISGSAAEAGAPTEADAAVAPREASLLVRCAGPPGRGVHGGERRSPGGLRDSEPGRR